MVDLVGTRGVIWEHELWERFEYFQDRPYFHSFPGDVSLSSVVCWSLELFAVELVGYPKS